MIRLDKLNYLPVESVTPSFLPEEILVNIYNRWVYIRKDRIKKLNIEGRERPAVEIKEKYRIGKNLVLGIMGRSFLDQKERILTFFVRENN